MALESTTRVVRELAQRGYNADREAVTLLASAGDPQRAIDRAVEAAPDDAPVLSATQVRRALETPTQRPDDGPTASSDAARDDPQESDDADPTASTGDRATKSRDNGSQPPVETGGSPEATESVTRDGQSVPTGQSAAEQSRAVGDRSGTDGPRALDVSGDITSTGTGEYGDFVSLFRDRYERLAGQLRGRVNHRPAATVADMTDGSETAIIGMVADIRSTTSDHLRIELEDTSGTYPCLVLKDREFAAEARDLLCDEVIAVKGSISKNDSGDDGILFVDELYVPDVPNTNSPSTADRPVQAALISDVHVGSQEFLAGAWERFADWLHTEAAESVEYLLIAGDMVEGVGVYPDQDEELDIVDIYDQYERFSEHLKDVPGDMEIVMIPGNHDAVRLAEPQPAFDEELRSIMSAHDATISANPSTVTIEGVSVLMYHGVSLDEIIAELPDASYEAPAEAMTHLLRKRHLAPQYGGLTRIAPEEQDHLVIEDPPDIFHTGHVHKFGYTEYNGVLSVNSSCWQTQTAYQQSVNLEPDVGYVSIVDLDTLDLTVANFA